MMVQKHIFLILKSCLLYLSCFSQAGKDTSINFYFAINSAQLDSNQYKKLNSLSSAFHIKSIKGYADTTGAKKYNLSLSKNRALSVYAVLSNGLASATKINLLHLGESAEESELWKNRRVQVIASPILQSEVANQIPVNKPAGDTTVNIPTVVRSFDLNYVYFIPDQAIITQESLSYMQEIAEILKTYKTQTFEIIGHINYQSRFDSSHLTDIYQLSTRRAKAVYDLLVEQGIPANKMAYKGVGNSQPVYPSPINDEQRRKNMRVQIVVKK
jgi:outer membrane protein OmpA-like peptidoglycan-associated protein